MDHGGTADWLGLGCMAAPDQVRERGLRLLRRRISAGPACDDNASEGSICANVAISEWTLHYVLYVPWRAKTGLSCERRPNTVTGRFAEKL